MGAGREVTLPARGTAGPTPAYLAVPEGARAGVVVIHEMLGRQPEIERVVDRFAARGYAAILPDLFCDGSLAACIMRTVREVGRGAGPSFDRTSAARDFLVSEAKLDPAKVGIIGFCFGGGFALVAGAGYAAVSANYGAVPARLPDGLGPLIACYGGRDRAFGGQAKKLEALAARQGKAAEVHVFPNAGHSFLTDGRHAMAFLSYPLLRIRYDAETAEAGWTKINAFFDRHLG